MTKSTMRIFFFLFFAFTAQCCLAQEKWTLTKNEDGIAIYTRRLNNEKFKEIKAVCDFPGSTDRLIKILKNVNRHIDWVYATKRSFLLSQKSPDTLFYYSETELPWPLSNRDLALQLTFSKDKDNTVSIQAKSMPQLVPRKANIVRVPYSLASWRVTDSGNYRIKIEYTFSVDPGGSLPSWLVNYTATAGPFNTFKKLKAMLEKQH